MPPNRRSSDDVGANIRAEMGRRKINMVQLSQLTGVPRTTLLSQMNVGTISVDNLVLIAKALEVDVRDLLPEDSEVAS